MSVIIPWQNDTGYNEGENTLFLNKFLMFTAHRVPETQATLGYKTGILTAKKVTPYVEYHYCSDMDVNGVCNECSKNFVLGGDNSCTCST